VKRIAAKTILVVEAKGDWLDLLNQVMTRSGYDVIEASSDFDSIWEAAATPPDLILLDLRYLGTNADKVLSNLRMDQSTKNIPVIVQATYGDDGIDRAILAGAKQGLYKPFDLAALPSVLREHLATPKNER